MLTTQSILETEQHLELMVTLHLVVLVQQEQLIRSVATETDTQYTINLSLDSHPAADPNVIPASDSATFKVYSEHTPSFTGITTIGINSTSNSGLPITFTNTTESTIGSFSDFGNQIQMDIW